MFLFACSRLRNIFFCYLFVEGFAKKKQLMSKLVSYGLFTGFSLKMQIVIIQWVILAVRNICENNPENQAVIADISKVGVVESAILQEMGLTLHDEGDKKIGIAPLHLKK